MKTVMLFLIRAYQLVLSPVIGSRCRYLPTCSCYAHTAINRYGLLRGGWMSLRRLGRCHPWGSSGYDPVPEKDTSEITRTHHG
jgi:putative membrane protein insertion efficiency factor